LRERGIPVKTIGVAAGFVFELGGFDGLYCELPGKPLRLRCKREGVRSEKGVAGQKAHLVDEAGYAFEP